MTLSKIGQDETRENMDMAEHLRKTILGVLEEIDKGFKKAMLMYLIAFYFGLFLILFSMMATLFTKEGLGNNNLLFFGGAGMIDIVAFFIFKPTKDLQKSRANLAQLVAAFIFWYINTRNWNVATEKEVRAEKTNIDNLEKISKRHLIDTISILLTMYNMFVEGKNRENVTENIDKAIMKLKERIGDS